VKIINEYLLPRCRSNGPSSYWVIVKFLETDNDKIFECLGNEDYKEIDKELFGKYQKYCDENYKEHIVR
jgi:hypothetical protein